MLFASCDNNNLDNKELEGREVPVRIRSLGVVQGGSETLTRSSLQKEPEMVSTVTGDGMLLEMRIQEDESPLRADIELSDGAYFRVIAVTAGTTKYYSHGDFVYGDPITLLTDFHVKIGGEYDYICISYNNTDLPDASGYTVNTALPGSVSFSTAKDLLWCRMPGEGPVTDAGVELAIILAQRLTKVKVTVDCSYNGWEITGVATNQVAVVARDPDCTMDWETGDISGGTIDQGLSFTISDPTRTDQTSSEVAFIPTESDAVIKFKANAISRNGYATAVPVGLRTATLSSALSEGVSYTILVRMRTPIWARSNVYWDAALNGGAGALTFVPAGSDKSKESVGGVFFHWGTLVGRSEGVFTQTKLYAPDGSGGWTIDDYNAFPVPYWDSSQGDVIDNTQYGSMRGDICEFLSTETHVVAGNYRLPTAYEFGHESATTSWTGRTDSWARSGTSAINTIMDNLTLPAVGWRDAASGLLTNPNADGIYWSGTGVSGSTYTLDFNSGRIYACYANSRNYGFSVRCVQK